MALKNALPTLLAFACLVCMFSGLLADPYYGPYTSTDITGRDIDCGQGATYCKYCTTPSALMSKCWSNELCFSVTHDGRCGYLKTSRSAGDGTHRAGWSTYWLNKTPGWRRSTSVDITGRDINCGQGTTYCKYCTNPSNLISKCRANPSCYSVTYDGSCGYLKTSRSEADGTYRSGWTTYWLNK